MDISFKEYISIYLIGVILGSIFGAVLVNVIYGSVYHNSSVFNDIMKTANYVSSNYTYDRNNFNCVHFSNTLRDMLKDKGYFASSIVVTSENLRKEGIKHKITILHLPIEAQTGKIISPKEWKELGYYVSLADVRCMFCNVSKE